MKFKITPTDVQKTTVAFNAAGRAVKAAVAMGIREWLEVVATDSQLQVPRLTGRLANSMVLETKQTPAPVGSITYRAPHAAFVHEIPRPPSSNGKWHFLTDPFMWHEPELLPTIAARVEEALAAVAVGKALRSVGKSMPKAGS